ncbi:MAG TPA: hypothetical protein VKK31_05775 [Thermoanaerobaculia bacterium]|nr:hypothetical protein [Thermoanaerobaculia bacterium]
MSLISDALKKARQEAARQDSLRQGVPYAVGPVDAPVRRNPLLPMLAGLGAGCLVAGILFAVAYMAGWGPFGKPAQEGVRVADTAALPAAPPPPVVQESAAALPPSETSPPPPQPQAVPQEPPPAAVPAPEVRPQIEMRPSVPVEPPLARTEPQATPPPVPAPVEEASPVPAQVPQASPAPTPEGGLVDGQVYTGEVPVPGGGSVKLNGIAFSQDRPIAVIAGRVMGPGEVIEGFTVVSIEPGRVTLQGHGATVYLAPK